MKKKKLNLFIFIDSYGYELVKKHGPLLDSISTHHPLEMQFGYSATAIPTILTGKKPEEHGQFTFFYRDINGTSPFKFFDSLWFKLIPKFIAKRRRFRILLSRIFKKACNIQGYFDLYAVPFEYLKFFDYSEKNDLFANDAFPNVKNLKDVLDDKNIKHFISNWRQTEEENFRDLEQVIMDGDTEFIFAYFAGLDGVQHMHTKDGKETVEKLNYYKENLESLLKKANERYLHVDFAIFSDHGMTTLINEIDVNPILEQTELKYGTDYLSFIDSTMLRLWYFSDESKNVIQGALNDANLPGRFLSSSEKESWGINFSDHKYGDDIYLVDPGVQLNPSDMGGKALPGMHGYDPSDKDSDALWMANFESLVKPDKVQDIFNVMMEKVNEIEKSKVIGK